MNNKTNTDDMVALARAVGVYDDGSDVTLPTIESMGGWGEIISLTGVILAAAFVIFIIGPLAAGV